MCSISVDAILLLTIFFKAKKSYVYQKYFMILLLSTQSSGPFASVTKMLAKKIYLADYTNSHLSEIYHLTNLDVK